MPSALESPRIRGAAAEFAATPAFDYLDRAARNSDGDGIVIGSLAVMRVELNRMVEQGLFRRVDAYTYRYEITQGGRNIRTLTRMAMGWEN